MFLLRLALLLSLHWCLLQAFPVHKDSMSSGWDMSPIDSPETLFDQEFIIAEAKDAPSDQDSIEWVLEKTVEPSEEQLHDLLSKYKKKASLQRSLVKKLIRKIPMIPGLVMNPIPTLIWEVVDEQKSKLSQKIKQSSLTDAVIQHIMDVSMIETHPLGKKNQSETRTHCRPTFIGRNTKTITQSH
jgi:hypothetical protein